jgi:hypothetical protein
VKVAAATLIELNVAAFVAMLALGAAHSADERVPALGWQATLWITIAVMTVIGGALVLAEIREDDL